MHHTSSHNDLNTNLLMKAYDPVLFFVVAVVVVTLR